MAKPCLEDAVCHAAAAQRGEARREARIRPRLALLHIHLLRVAMLLLVAVAWGRAVVRRWRGTIAAAVAAGSRVPWWWCTVAVAVAAILRCRGVAVGAVLGVHT
jgi:type IV secretory pathway TraG/TraD family ATPase VirD4